MDITVTQNLRLFSFQIEFTIKVRNPNKNRKSGISVIRSSSRLGAVKVI